MKKTINTVEPKMSEEEKIKKEAEAAAREKIKQEAIEGTKQKMVIVDVEDIAEAEAAKAADKYMTEDKGKSNIFKNFWKHTFMEGYYRQRQVVRVRQEIKDSGNIYAGREDENNKIEQDEAMKAITDRFVSDYDGLIDTVGGEKKEILNNEDPKTVRAKTDIKNLITNYAQTPMADAAFIEEKNRILNFLYDKNNKNTLNSYADNLLEIAKNARIAIDHEVKIEELNLDTNIILGKAKSSLRTEAHYNTVDKAVAWTKKSTIGKFMSPALVSTGIGLAYSLSVGLGAKALRSKAAAYGTFGAAVAISTALAGMNESQRLAAERAQHGLDMAENSGKIVEGSKRREKMQEFQYEMVNSKNLEENLLNLMFTKDDKGDDIPKEIDPADLDRIFAGIAQIDARKSLNKTNKIDLISYSNIGNVEKESTDLSILTARAKEELNKKIQGGLTNTSLKGKTFDSYLAEQTEIIKRSLLGGEKGITSLDKNFSSYKTTEVIKKVVKTALIGLTVGAVVQEGVAFFKDGTQGFVEGMFHRDPNAITQTPLENLRGWITGHPSHMGLGNAINTQIDGHDFKLPAGTSLIHNPDGTYNILRGDQVVSDHIPLHFDNAGNIDQESMARLGKDGIIAHTTCTTIEGTKQITGTAEEYIKNHPGGTTHIARDGWYDNDTAKPIFDQNELKLQMGGVNGTGIDAHGNYVLDMHHMTSGGSFHENLSVDAQKKMSEGLLKMAFSLTQGTQHQVFEIPIDANGNAVIDPNSEIGKLFFGSENGHAVFKGRFAEVIESFGEKNGVEHVRSLATLVGEGNNLVHNIVPNPVEVPITNLDLPLDTEPPMFIPIIVRKPLEKLSKSEKEDKKTAEKNNEPEKNQEVNIELEKAQQEERAVFAEYRAFATQNPTRKIPIALERRYTAAEKKLAEEKAKDEEKKKNTAVNITTHQKANVLNTATHSPTISPENKSKATEKKQPFKDRDLTRPGTVWEDQFGKKHTITGKLLDDGWTDKIRGKTSVQGFVIDSNGKELKTFYNIRDLKRKFKEGIIKITKVEAKK